MMDFTEEQENELRNIFEDFDEDKSGTLNVKELRHIGQLFGLNPSRSEVEEVLKRHDKNEDGGLDFEELKTLVAELYKTEEEEQRELEHAITTLLENNDIHEENLTADMVFNILQKGEEPMTKEEIEEIFEDLNKETITKEEMVELFCR